MNLGGTVRLNRTGWVILGLIVCILLVLHLSRSTRETDSNRYGAFYSVGELLKVAVIAARAGGDTVSTAVPNRDIHSKGKTREGVDQPVTAADLESHCRMSAIIKKAFPDVILISEEKPENDCPILTSARPDITDLPDLPQQLVSIDDVTVWIDPLDATKEYTEKLYQYVTTMVCVAIKGVPIIGVIHRPFSKETYWTWNAKVHSPNLKRTSSSNHHTSKTRVIVSISHQGPVKSLVSKAFGSENEIIAAAGAGYKVLELVHGNADVYLHNTLIKKWDICAGNAIINHFGGRMTTLNNTTIDYSSSSSPENDHGLLAAIVNHGVYIEKINHLDV